MRPVLPIILAILATLSISRRKVHTYLRVGEGDGGAKEVLEHNVEALPRVGHRQRHGGRELGARAVLVGGALSGFGKRSGIR